MFENYYGPVTFCPLLFLLFRVGTSVAVMDGYPTTAHGVHEEGAGDFS